jgi:hypothetical protein
MMDGLQERALAGECPDSDINRMIENLLSDDKKKGISHPLLSNLAVFSSANARIFVRRGEVPRSFDYHQSP